MYEYNDNDIPEFPVEEPDYEPSEPTVIYAEELTSVERMCRDMERSALNMSEKDQEYTKGLVSSMRKTEHVENMKFMLVPILEELTRWCPEEKDFIDSIKKFIDSK